METNFEGIRVALILATAALLIVGIIFALGVFKITEALNFLVESVDELNNVLRRMPADEQKGKGEEK